MSEVGSAPLGQRPALSFWQIWNMCFGFLGIQFGFALQNANVSRIFQTLGADIDQIPILWIAAPLTGLIVQPIVGHFSDRTWTRLGRRRPYFLAGAILTSLALLVMPNSPTLWVAAGMLWIMDASINVSMEPFRAYVADQMPPRQRPTGFAMQSFFIGIGAIVASALPWILAQWGVDNVAEDGGVPDTVRYAFYCGAVVLFGAIGWTVISTREYPPDQLHGFSDSRESPPRRIDHSAARLHGLSWCVLSAGGALAVMVFELDAQLYLLAGGVFVYGLSLLWLSMNRPGGFVTAIMADLHGMPDKMRRLALVQFFSWFALFAMWIYTTAGVADYHYNATDPGSAAYNDGANWVGVLFAAYNGFAALAAVVIPFMVKRLGLRRTHLVNLWLGAAGFLSFLVIADPAWLLLSMVGVGFAWASILSLPYAMLSDSVPTAKMGTYMGIFNFFIVIPQLVAASVLGFLLKTFFGAEPIHALVIGAISLFVAGLTTLRVQPAVMPVRAAGSEAGE